jgi:DNA-binding transcriptional LysR family regulator
MRAAITELEPEVALPALVAGEFDLVLGEEYPGQPLPRPRETERHDLLTDELRLITPAGWSERSLTSLASRPFVMEPVGTTAREWATAACRQAGFEPDVRYTSTDLQIHLRLAESGLAAALLPDLSGAGDRQDVLTHRLQGRPRRQIFSTVRRGAARYPKVQAFTTALKAHGPSQTPGAAWSVRRRPGVNV